jgi:hypothetical protein
MRKETAMAWYLALQGSTHMTNQSSVYELQNGVDVDVLAQKWSVRRRWTAWSRFLRSRRKTRVTAVKITRYVRPAAGVTKTFSDIMSGAKDDRPDLPALLEYVREGRHRRGVEARPARQTRRTPQASRSV